jgi:hypothetical protein
LRIPPEDKLALERFAYRRGETVSEIVRRAVAAEIEELRAETQPSGNVFIDKALAGLIEGSSAGR